MLKTAFAIFLVQFLKVDSKFYQTDIAPYGIGGGHGSYSTQEYDPEVGYPYGLSYRKYPEISYQDARAFEADEAIPGPIRGIRYGQAGGLEYPRKIRYGGYGGYSGGFPLGSAGGFPIGSAGGYPLGIGRGIGYGYGHGSGSPLDYSQIPHRGLGSIYPHGRLDFYGSNSPYGVSQIDKGLYSDGKQNIIGEHYNNVQGINGQSQNHGDVGFNKGETAYRDIKGDSVRFVDSDGVDRGHHEGKTYAGGEHFNDEGKHGQDRFLSEDHNKGHNIKGFKKSHHLDETGKTEEFFDQDHDKGGNYAFDGRFGKHGEEGGNAYRGGFKDGKYKTGEATKQGNYDVNYSLDKAQGGSGKFGGNNYAQNEEAYGLNKGFGERGLTGHRENSNIYKNYPTGGFGYGGYY